MFRLVRLLAVATAVIGVALPGPSHAATLIGDVIHAEYDYPTSVYPNSSVSVNPFTVGPIPGIESVIDVEGVTELSIDFSASMLVITLNTTLSSPTWNIASQNGPSFTVLSGSAFPAIEGVVSSNAGPVSAFLSSGILFVNWAGMSYKNGDTVTVMFAPAPILTPLPAALPLFATSLGALGVLGWRRKRKNVAIAA